jgi:DNA-binding transcriptional LysR family regulator
LQKQTHLAENEGPFGLGPHGALARILCHAGDCEQGSNRDPKCDAIHEILLQRPAKDGFLWSRGLAPAGTAVYELVADAHRAEGVEMAAAAVTTYSMMLRLQLLASGQFVTAFPESLVRNCAQAWNLVALPLALGTAVPVSAYTLRGRAASRAIAAFIDAARSVNRGSALDP